MNTTAKPHWTRNIRRWMERGSRADRLWYTETNLWVRSVGPLHRTAAIMAALSPGTTFERNKVETAALVNGTNVEFSTYPANVEKARRILAAPDGSDWAALVAPRWPQSGHKIRAFYENIVDPGGSRAVTIDRHAVAICLNRQPTPRELGLTWKAYRCYSRAYEIVADRHGLRPHELQAMTWVAWRDRNGDLHDTEDLPI